MGKCSNKRKNRNSSGEESALLNKSKQVKPGGPSLDSENSADVSVSDILSQVNNLLYGTVDEQIIFDMAGKEVNKEDVIDKTNDKADDNVGEPTNRDIMNCLKIICGRIANVEKRLGRIEQLEKKVDSFDKELKSIWTAIEDRAGRTDERVTKVEDKVDMADVNVGLVSSRITELEKERDDL